MSRKVEHDDWKTLTTSAAAWSMRRRCHKSLKVAKPDFVFLTHCYVCVWVMNTNEIIDENKLI